MDDGYGIPLLHEEERGGTQTAGVKLLQHRPFYFLALRLVIASGSEAFDLETGESV